MDSYPVLGNELSKETHILTKKKTLLRRDVQAKSGGVRDLPCHMACLLRFNGNSVSFQVVSDQSSCLFHIWSDAGSFVARTSPSQVEFQREGF